MYSPLLQLSTEDSTVTVSLAVESLRLPGHQGIALSLRAALPAPDFASVRKLSIDGMFLHHLCGPRSHSILCAFPRLTLLRVAPRSGPSDSLGLVSQNLASMLEALQVDADGAQTAAAVGPVTCPELARLWVDWPRVREDEDDSCKQVYDRPPQAVMDSFRELANARAARGHPFERVFVAHPRQEPMLGAVAYTVDEYDGAVTRMLKSTVLAMDDHMGARLLAQEFAREWDRIE